MDRATDGARAVPFAEERSVALAVPDTSCRVCAYMIGKSLAELDGARSARHVPGTKQLAVVYDDARCSIEALRAASARIGFSVSVLEDEAGP